MPKHSGGATTFETAIGTCGVAWGARGITAVELPSSRPLRMLERLRRKAGTTGHTEPPPDVREAIAAMTALLGGERRDLRGIELDLEGASDFELAVWDRARQVPAGETITYGEIAKSIAVAGDARDVGQAMGSNRCPIIIPCHRVVAAGGSLGGFSAPGGVETKRRMLEIEGAIEAELTLFDAAA
jgi:methylated-DNA-[protein]-cysteine S-methyltransferase